MSDTDRRRVVPRASRHPLSLPGIVALALLVVAAPAAVRAQPPTWSTEHVDESLRPELDAISARGRLLAEYDQAAWHGTAAVMSLRPDPNLIRGYLARRRADGLWEVVFGKLDAERNAFVIAFRAVQRAPGDTSYVATALSPRERDAEWYARAARALDVGRDAFGSVNRPYNAVVIPADEGGDWFVYLMPAQTRAGVFPLGGDARYRVSPDGRTMVAQRRLHNEQVVLLPGRRRRADHGVQAGRDEVT